MYSRRWLGEKLSNILRGFRLFLQRGRKSAGIGTACVFRLRPAGRFDAALLSSAAFFT